MDESSIQTVEDLKKKRLEALKLSEQALIAHPQAYREIKKLAKEVAFKTVDIGDYFAIASRLTELLGKMTKTGKGTIFAYFLQNIDPGQCGEARYFRGMCLDLHGQIDELDSWRANKRGLTVIK